MPLTEMLLPDPIPMEPCKTIGAVYLQSHDEQFDNVIRLVMGTYHCSLDLFCGGAGQPT